MISRRTLIAATASLVATPALAQRKAPVAETTINPVKLMEAGPLPEKALGSADAKVTIIEYASFTCGHCATFHNTTLPKLKEKYISTGKVRFIFREFPFDPVAAAVAMLSRCAPEDKYFDVSAVFFQEQASWARAQDVVGALRTLSLQLGFTQESFRACLTNQSLLDGVNALRDKASNDFKVDSTPTFFINGAMYKGAMPIEDFDAILAPLL